MGKEELGKIRSCDGAVEKKIVPFDRCSDGGRNHGSAKLRLKSQTAKGRGRRLKSVMAMAKISGTAASGARIFALQQSLHVDTIFEGTHTNSRVPEDRTSCASAAN